MTELRDGRWVGILQSDTLAVGSDLEPSLDEGEATVGLALREVLAESLSSRLAAKAILLPSDGDDRPQLILLDPEFGVIAFEIATDSFDRADREPYRNLNRKTKSLVATTSSLSDITIHKVVVLGGTAERLAGAPGTPDSQIRVLGRGDLIDVTWLNSLANSGQTGELRGADAIQVVARDLAPAFVFESRVRHGAFDDGATDRAALRFMLDQAQQHVAMRTVADVMVLSGPPGSGKTVVLASRARWLAEQHPEWSIQILCYNKALLRYLKSLVEGYDNVKVDSVHHWLDELGVHIADAGETAQRDLAKARLRGIRETIDALLIDEVQDFTREWLSFTFESVRPGLGGVVLAGDSAQALYRDGDPLAEAVTGRQVERVVLGRPYRSTQQILRVASALDPQSAVAGIESAPDGEPVDLIWAQTCNEQAAAVAWEIRKMIDSGERRADDIGVLVTQRPSTIKRLTLALTDQDVPHTVVTREAAAEYDPTLPGVKVMTVHAAKGHEFPVVFLFGLEALPDPDASDVVAVLRGRVGFVGMTRAKDQLLMTYSKDNVYLKRLKGLDDDLRQWTWPDEYEV